MFWPCETRTSTCRSFATISSGLYRFLAIAVLLDVKDIPQVGPLQWGWVRGPSMRIRLVRFPTIVGWLAPRKTWADAPEEIDTYGPRREAGAFFCSLCIGYRTRRPGGSWQVPARR